MYNNRQFSEAQQSEVDLSALLCISSVVHYNILQFTVVYCSRVHYNTIQYSAIYYSA